MKYALILLSARLCCSESAATLATEQEAKVTMTAERNYSNHVKTLRMTNKTPFFNTFMPHYEESHYTHSYKERVRLCGKSHWDGHGMISSGFAVYNLLKSE